MSYFAMKISGQPENVKDFVVNFRKRWGGISRFDFDPTQFEADYKSKLLSIVGEGNCHDTIKESMPGLREETVKSGLCIEVFLSDLEKRIQEHYLVDNGDILEKKCVYYDVVDVEGMSEEIFESFLHCQNMDRGVVLSSLNVCGEYVVGGLQNFGKFKDHLNCWPPGVPEHISQENNTHREKGFLDYIIQDAALMAQRQASGYNALKLHKESFER